LDNSLSAEARAKLGNRLLELLLNPEVPKDTLEKKAEEIFAAAD
jgi:hypothetical protein